MASDETSWTRDEVQALFSLIDELSDALEVVGLYAQGFERSLCDTKWAAEAADLNRAARRAADLVARLQSRWNG